MKEDRLIYIGVISYIVLSGINRFVFRFPNSFFILYAIFNVALILFGLFRKQSR